MATLVSLGTKCINLDYIVSYQDFPEQGALSLRLATPSGEQFAVYYATERALLLSALVHHAHHRDEGGPPS